MDPVRDYLNIIGRVPLLTAAEEIELGNAVRRMMVLIESGRSDFTKEERAAIRFGKKAKERMIKANLRLVVSIAKKYVSFTTSLELLDLIQEGTIGLNRAVELFDPARGYKFSTYGTWWIRQGVSRATYTHERLIRLPSAAVEALNKIQRWGPEFERKHGRMPSVSECAEYCGVTEPTMRQYMRHPSPVLSLDYKATGAEKEGSSLVDLIVDLSHQPELIETSQVEQLLAAIERLPVMQQKILKRYYGIGATEEEEGPITFTKIGKELGVSRQCVIEHKQRAFNAIKLALRNPPGKFPAHRTLSSLNWTLNKAA